MVSYLTDIYVALNYTKNCKPSYATKLLHTPPQIVTVYAINWKLILKVLSHQMM